MQRDDPNTKGKPCAVVQFNEWKGGGYEARAKGVNRMIRGDEAKEKCPDILLFKIPERNGKADLKKFRDASTEVVACISQFVGNIEKASIDEVYVDLTQLVNSSLGNESCKAESDDIIPANMLVLSPELRSHISNDTKLLLNHTALSVELNLPNWRSFLSTHLSCGKQLAIASELAYRIRNAIYMNTGFTCSVGIAENKSIAKLACSQNKPNKQTLVPPSAIPVLLSATPINKIRNLGGKLGASVAKLFDVKMLGDLTKVSAADLKETFGEKTGVWLHALCRGVDPEPVTPRTVQQSYGCSKEFRYRAALSHSSALAKWLATLAFELFERLIEDKLENGREASRATVCARLEPPSQSTWSSARSDQSEGAGLIAHSDGSGVSTLSRSIPNCTSLFARISDAGDKEERVTRLGQLALATLKEALGIQSVTEDWSTL